MQILDIRKGESSMFKFMIYSFLTFILLFSITACNQSEPQTMQQPDYSQTLNGSDAEFLLVAFSDPLGIEQEEAFKIDAAGPMYFWVLDLSEEQKEQIKEIVHDLRPNFKEMFSRWIAGKSWEEIREERMALREKIRKSIYEILTDEQKALVDQMAAQLAAGEFPDAVVEKRVEVLSEELGLSEEQQQHIKDLFKDYGSQLIQMRNACDNPKDFHLAKYEIFQELDAKIREILTEEQLESYDTFKRENRRMKFHEWFHGWSDKK
jgi:Spy/CpxP family protein refolding chaperone